MDAKQYQEFLLSKNPTFASAGFHVERDALSPMLFAFQRDIVQWALRKGRCAIFADTGLGKTAMQLEWARHVARVTEKPVLILAPLAVAEQTAQVEGAKFGVAVNLCESSETVAPGVNITNYEKLHRFDCSIFGGVVLDESSILKSFSGATRNLLVKTFAQTQYRLACTATPAPNDHTEMGNHSEFLGIMSMVSMRSRWFQHDSADTGEWYIKGHAIRDFWEWVSSWAVCIRKPSDLGYSDHDFNLPPLVIKIEKVKVAIDGDTEGQLFYQPDLSSTGIHTLMRKTCDARANRVSELVENTPGPVLIWCHTNYEADAIAKRIPGICDIRGENSNDEKKDGLLGFSSGKYRVLCTKPKIAGFGMNWQHCATVIFIGLSYSYESFYQSIRRCWRFGQSQPVTAYVVMSQHETALYDSVSVKRQDHEEMQEQMTKFMMFDRSHDYKLALENRRVENEKFTAINGDSIEEIKNIEDNSVGFSVFSPPFSSLYTYSDTPRDMGNCANDEEFFAHFEPLIYDLFRIMIPGRIVAVHCANPPTFKGISGYCGVKDFRGDIIRLFQKCGFTFHSEVTIWKDPVTEMQRTKSLGLLHKQLCKDSTRSRQGMADYLCVFRKTPKDESECIPVVGKNDMIRFRACDYAGEDMPISETERSESIEVWQRYASPVWFDIRQTRTLNARQSRNESDEKHICPLQLDVIERAIHLWSNDGDLVFSPFMGIGSEGYCALKMARRFLGIELKREYFDQAIKNLNEAANVNQLTLF